MAHCAVFYIKFVESVIKFQYVSSNDGVKILSSLVKCCQFIFSIDGLPTKIIRVINMLSHIEEALVFYM